MTASAPLNPFIPFLMGLYVALFGDSVARLLTALFSIFKKKGKKVLFHSVLSFCLASALLVFGIVNSQIVTPKYLNFSSSKLTHEYKIAFVADLHIGSAQPIEKAEETINRIIAEDPDFIFIGGDFVDELTSKEDIQKGLSFFKNCAKPVYFIYGNHEEVIMDSGEENLQNAIISSGINILDDEFLSLSGVFTVLGRADLSSPERKPIENLHTPDDDSFLLAIDHQPFSHKDNNELNYDLQLTAFGPYPCRAAVSPQPDL